jgi:hypothetical protein
MSNDIPEKNDLVCFSIELNRSISLVELLNNAQRKEKHATNLIACFIIKEIGTCMIECKVELNLTFVFFCIRKPYLSIYPM